jgi:hypothetical protein
LTTRRKAERFAHVPADGNRTRNETPQIVEPVSMRVSPFDQVSALLQALLWFIAVFVALLFLLWLTNKLQFRAAEVIAVPPENAAGRGPNAEGFERDFEPPGEQEVEELVEPTLAETLEAVTDVASTVAAALDVVDSDSVTTQEGTGRGDSRPPGPLGEGDDIVPRFERWQLKFAAKSIQQYAAQLDFFGIELGAIGGGAPGVDYAGGFSGSPQSRHGDDGAAEQRLYFRWTAAGVLDQYDEQLLQRAAIDTNGRIRLKFISKELEEQLAGLEYRHAVEQGYKSVAQIQRTVFECRPDGNGYVFRVIEQRYRVPKQP